MLNRTGARNKNIKNEKENADGEYGILRLSVLASIEFCPQNSLTMCGAAPIPVCQKG